MAEYRPVPEDHEDDQGRIVSYSFDAGSGPYDPDAAVPEHRERRWGFGEQRGMFEGEELLVCATHVEFDARLRGSRVPLAGLSAVASPPEHRRKGLVADLLAASLAEYRDRGWPLSALRPFEESFYARYGWATGTRYVTATVDPAALAPAAAAADGEFRRIRPAEAPSLDPVYEAWLEGVDLATRRSDEWWRDRLLFGHRGERYCYAYERDGRVLGYLIYDVEDRTMTVRELAARDREGFLGCLRFCHYHDSQVNEVELTGYGHERLLDVVSDRDALEVRLHPGQMVRAVDVPAALSAPDYGDAGPAEVTVAVEDDHAPWNDDTFAVRVAAGEATVDRTDADPGAATDVGTLSQLLVGYRSVADARAAGDLSLRDPAAAETLSALFPERAPFLPERF